MKQIENDLSKKKKSYSSNLPTHEQNKTKTKKRFTTESRKSADIFLIIHRCQISVLKIRVSYTANVSHVISMYIQIDVNRMHITKNAHKMHIYKNVHKIYIQENAHEMYISIDVLFLYIYGDVPFLYICGDVHFRCIFRDLHFIYIFSNVPFWAIFLDVHSN